jgi:hypothetical protein
MGYIAKFADMLEYSTFLPIPVSCLAVSFV